MSSSRKITANRASAKSSTGPKTTSGRLRSSKNARRHGLSIPVVLDPILSQQVKALAMLLTKRLGHLCPIASAHRLAEAEVDLMRTRKIKNDLLGTPNDQTAGAGQQVIKEMLLLDRYEQRALARRKSAIRQLTRELSNATENWQNEAKKTNNLNGALWVPTGVG